MSSEFDLKDFKVEVVEESQKRPVVLDFWAEWCGPCKTLGPTIEKLAKAAKGRWKLIKIDTELHQQIAGQFGIKSIPSVKMVYQGKIIGEFTGALPEHEIVKWLNQFLPPVEEEAGGISDVYEALQMGERPTAFELVKNLFIDEPTNEEYRSVLAMLLLPNELGEAERILAPLANQSKYAFEMEALVTIKVLQAIHSNERQISEEAHPKTIESFKRGLDAFFNSDFESALDAFIQSILFDKSFEGELARKSCVAIFKLLTEHDPISKAKRRAFSMALT